MIRKILFVILICLTISSCSIADRLGFDTYDYMGEQVLVTHEVGSEIYPIIEAVLNVVIMDSPELAPFDSMSESIREYRDEVLSYMLEHDYSKYSGNLNMIQRAEVAYPEYEVTQIIPVDDFEAIMYRYFGGNVKITHRDCERFIFLPKVEAYISIVNPKPSKLYPKISSISETEKTYRVTFCVTDGDEVTSSEYFALIIKRDDGSQYIKQLSIVDETQ